MQWFTSTVSSCSPVFPADSSGVEPLQDALVGQFSTTDSKYSSRMIWLSDETPCLESESKFPVPAEWDGILRVLQGEMVFAPDQLTITLAMLAWAVLRNMLVDFSSVPTVFLPI